jgi:hypothetical protein
VDRGSLLGMEDWDLLGERRKVVVEDLRFEVEERRAAMKRELEFSQESEENCKAEEYLPSKTET